MIDFENDLRRRFDDAASDVSASPDLLGTIEHRVSVQDRRTGALRIAAVVAVLGLAVGGAIALAPGNEDASTTRATDPTASSTTVPATTAPPPGWAAMAEAPIAARFQHLAVDMDGQVLVYGGYLAAPLDVDDNDSNDAAVYDTATDVWTAVPEAPLHGGSAVGVWTGEVAVVVNNGSDAPADQRRAAAFDPDTGTWTELAAPPPGISANAVVHAVWTGTEVVVVTGAASEEDEVAIYDPATDTWRQGSLPDSPPPAFGDLVWTGSEVVAVGYDAAHDSGPQSPTVDQSIILAYDPAADTWRSLPWGPAADARMGSAVVWTGDRLFVGGGVPARGDGVTRADAGLLDPATGEWTAVPDAPVAFAGNDRYDDVWTGSEVLVLGEGAVPLAFDPAAGTWTAGPALGSDVPAEVPTIWSAGRVVVPQGGFEQNVEGGTQCCPTGAAGGLTYVP